MSSRRVPVPPVTLLLTLVVGAAVTAAPARGQEGCDGVAVVVDAVDVGGQVTTRCAPGDPDTGFEALRSTGHDYTFVPRQPGLVCTIDARPDPCNGAPQDAYWSYWYAEAGGSWTYATRGAGNRDPAPGTVEGWAFGAGDPPRQPPPAAASPADPEPNAPSEAAPTAEPHATAGPDTAAEDATPVERDDAPQPTATATDEATEDEAEVVASLASPDPSASPTVLEEPPGPDSSPAPSPGPLAGEVGANDGAPVGLVAAGVLIAGLAGAGVVRARRRDHG